MHLNDIRYLYEGLYHYLNKHRYIFMKPFIIMPLAACIFLSSCEKDKTAEGNKFNATPPENIDGKGKNLKFTYPFDRVITDKRQREVDAIVIGRTRTEVIFQIRNSKNPNKHHYYLIADLSSTDQKFLNRLPIQKWNGGGGSIVESLVREQLRLERAIEERIQDKKSTPEALTRVRALNREIEALEKELLSVKTEIKEQREKDASGS